MQGVQFGSTPADSFTVVNATEIRAHFPATLANGRHTIHLQTNAAGVKEFAQMAVVDAPTFTAQALAYPGTKESVPNAVVYDPERAALGVSIWHPFTGETEFVHFASDHNVWQAPIALPLINSYGFALSQDGNEWIAVEENSLIHIDVNTLTRLASVVSPVNPDSSLQIADMAVANDGTLVMFADVSYNCGATLILYDPQTHAFDQPEYTACRGHVGASSDGSRVLIAEYANFGANDIFSVDTTAKTTSETGVPASTSAKPELDRTGSRVVFDKTRVYDGQYTHLGDLPGTTEAIVLNPEGTRAYAYDQSGKLIAYALDSPPVGGIFQQAGSPITLAASPGTQWAPPYIDTKVMMAITPDGKTVFIAGNDYVVVQPVP